MAGTKIVKSMAGLQTDAIPESKVFGGGGDESCPASLRGKHLNGTLVDELPETWRWLTPDRTDEGLAERNSGASSLVAGATSFDMALEERAAQLENNVEPWAINDPIGTGVRQHVPPGYRGKLLSAARVEKEGNYGRGWQVVVKDGQPVRVGGDLVGIMPEATAEKRNRHFVNEDRKKVTRNEEKNLQASLSKSGVKVTTDV